MEGYESDKEQWEWVKEQVRQNGPAVIIAVALAVAAVFSWRWWQAHQDTRQLVAGGMYMQMVQALERGDRTQALVLLGELERDYASSPYTDQAKLLAGRVYVDDGELDRAAGELAGVAERSKDRELAVVARLRLARVEIAQGKPDGALATLGGSAAAAGAFAARYHEVRGDAYYAKGDKATALSEYRSAQAAGAGTDAALLQLKIADLAGAAPPVTPVAVQQPAAPAPGK
ncbi:MAG TPA: tetratricopeptide repeat protein [Steroidobacteraceae bacterium]|nr:tetratricopeptide repeat protein [Steroidobacteraceae bacterium]